MISASAGLIVYALTATFAGIDWLESLTPEFHSSIYGLLFLTFELLAGFAFALTVALWRPDAPTFRYGAILLSVASFNLAAWVLGAILTLFGFVSSAKSGVERVTFRHLARSKERRAARTAMTAQAQA